MTSFLEYAVQFPAFLCTASGPQSVHFLPSGRVTGTFLLVLCDWMEVCGVQGLLQAPLVSLLFLEASSSHLL